MKRLLSKVNLFFPVDGNGSHSWGAYYCPSVVSAMTHIHTCRHGTTEHYQHQCQHCEFRWAE